MWILENCKKYVLSLFVNYIFVEKKKTLIIIKHCILLNLPSVCVYHVVLCFFYNYKLIISMIKILFFNFVCCVFRYTTNCKNT